LLGCIAFPIWARAEKTWPFGPKDIREEFLHTNGEHTEAQTSR
jgi:fructoselysine transporter